MMVRGPQSAWCGCGLWAAERRTRERDRSEIQYDCAYSYVYASYEYYVEYEHIDQSISQAQQT